MKKYFKIILPFLIVSSLCSCGTNNVNNNIKNAIDKTNNYLNNNEIDNNMFSYYLQDILPSSLVYSLDDNSYLIHYKNKSFVYQNNKLEEKSNQSFNYVDNYEKAFSFPDGSLVYTKGFSKANDGGNACLKVSKNLEIAEDQFYLFDETSSKYLNLISFNNSCNIKQLGYIAEDLNVSINESMDKYSYSTIYVPNGNYRVIDNIEINKSNKHIYAYNAEVYSDDSYNPTEGYNNGCLFYIYNNVNNIKISGFNVTIKVNKKLDDPLLGLMNLRDAEDVSLYNCSFYLPHEASIYSSSGIIDLFTNWKNVTVKNCHLENHASTAAGGGIGVRDIYKKGCSGATFENNYLYCNCKDEVIAVFSGGDTSLYPNETGGGYIKDVLFKNNIIIGDKPDENLGPRVVGLTVGYQLSPVENITFTNNYINMYAANYLLLYGKAKDVFFKKNNVKINSTYQENLFTMFTHNSYADEAFSIFAENNSFELIENSTIFTIAQAGKEFSFINNYIKGKQICRVFDSISTFKNNRIEVDTISKCVYHNVKNVEKNNISAKYITVVFEFYNLNIQSDITISDTIETEEISANLLMFNGDSILSNNYSVNFNKFNFSTEKVDSNYYYIAYGTSSLKDKMTINFINSSLSVFEDSKHNFIANDNDNMVEINYIR